MASKALPMTILILRLFTFIFLLVSIIVLATNNLTVSDSNSPSGKDKVTFKDVHAYRYVLSVAVIGLAYTLLQIPFSAIHISKGKHPAGGDAVSNLFLFTDMVFSLLLASGVGAGFGFTVDVKRLLDKFASGIQDLTNDFNSIDESGVSDALSKADKFLDVAQVSTGFLLMATVCMAAVTLISFHAFAKK